METVLSEAPLMWVAIGIIGLIAITAIGLWVWFWIMELNKKAERMWRRTFK